jgi:hypothetical protein
LGDGLLTFTWIPKLLLSEPIYLSILELISFKKIMRCSKKSSLQLGGVGRKVQSLISFKNLEKRSFHAISIEAISRDDFGRVTQQDEFVLIDCLIVDLI